MIRVIRELIYEYTSPEVAEQDMAMWQHGLHQFGVSKQMTSRIVSREEVSTEAGVA